MLNLLLSVLFAVVIVGLIYWLVTLLPIAQPFKQVGLVACVLILILWLFGIVGFFGPGWRISSHLAAAPPPSPPTLAMFLPDVL